MKIFNISFGLILIMLGAFNLYLSIYIQTDMTETVVGAMCGVFGIIMLFIGLFKNR